MCFLEIENKTSKRQVNVITFVLAQTLALGIRRLLLCLDIKDFLIFY